MNQTFKSLSVLILLAGAAILFLATPLPLLSSEEALFRRGLLFFLPWIDTPSYYHQIFGESPIWFDLDRIKIIGVGLFELAAVLGTGRLVLAILFSGLKEKYTVSYFSSKEKLFLSFLLGMSFVSSYLFYMGAIGRINRITSFPLILLGMAEITHWFTAGIKLFLVSRKTTNHIVFCRLSPESILGGLIVVLGSVYLLAGTIPPYEYDMLEYHAQGAREIFESGRIVFFEHNVYLNMPLASDMFYLAGILISPFEGSNGIDSLCIGVTAGKFFLAFVPLFCALGAGIVTMRVNQSVHNNKLLRRTAAFSVLAMPEIFQVSANGLNETLLGLTILGTFYSGFFVVQNEHAPVPRTRFFFLYGVAVGLAAACKYTAIPFVVIPALIFLSLNFLRQPDQNHLASFVLFLGGGLIVGGGWYLKNIFLTGNPFYPLAFSLFGDKTGTWNVLKNTRWTAAHSAHSFALTDLLADVNRVFADNFTSMILTFLPILLLLFFIGEFRRWRHPVLFLVLYLPIFYFLWWFSTHRLLRFLVPVLPVAGTVVAILENRYYQIANLRLVRGIYLFLWILCGLYSLSLNLVSTPGLLAPVRELAEDPLRYGQAAIFLAQSPQSETMQSTNLLLIGEARGFAYRRTSILYNTCWDNARLAKILPKNHNSILLQKWTEEEKHEIRKNFEAANIGSILVDYNEINRFLSPGNYGLTDEEYYDPALFENLVNHGIIEPIVLPGMEPNIKLYKIK